MNIFYEVEVVPAPFGRGWTVVRGGRDSRGFFQEWIGENYPTHAEAEAAAHAWNLRCPATEVRP